MQLAEQILFNFLPLYTILCINKKWLNLKFIFKSVPRFVKILFSLDKINVQSLKVRFFIPENLNRRMGKQTICIGVNKGADQLRSNCEADQRFCFRYMDSTIPLLSKSKISSL